MEIRWLETFAVAAREGSMSGAADRLGYARSTVTGHIQNLERSLGVKLFDRHSPSHPLTMSGVALLDHAEDILDSMERARVAVVEAEGGTEASLHVGATDSVCAYRLPIFLRMLSRFVPNVKVEVETGAATRLREQVVAGRPEVVLVNGVRSEDDRDLADSECLARQALWEEETVLVGTGDEAASPRRVLVTGPDCVYRRLTEREILRQLPGAEVLQVGNLEGVKSAALAGLGVGLLPVVAIKPWLSSGKVKALPVYTGAKVITEVVWNVRKCPTDVALHLRRMRLSTSAPTV
ncbi:LysR family transcriptional regulator [Streptomyces sp. NPDC048664]|uniref:LysR family transcriptional regulator n=1 Tax=Streptomyces sp. NPDC048664 TaxID=3154505 RepID=UPI0034222D7A